MELGPALPLLPCFFQNRIQKVRGNPQFDRFRHVLLRLLVPAHSGIGERPVGVGRGVLGVEADGLAAVVNGQFKLSQLSVSQAPVKVGIGVLGG